MVLTVINNILLLRFEPNPFRLFFIHEENKIKKCELLMYTANVETSNRIIFNSVKIAKKTSSHVLIVKNIMELGKVLLAREVSKVDSGVYEFKFTRLPDKYFHFFNWKCETISNKQLSYF